MEILTKPKFRIPYDELCQKCREILEQRKKEYFRFKDRIRKANNSKLAKKK